MICSSCGGNVEWQGAITNLTHTKCLKCGATNNQVVEQEFNEDFEEKEGDDNCPNCGKEYDEIDHEYQICHHCNFENKK